MTPQQLTDVAAEIMQRWPNGTIDIYDDTLTVAINGGLVAEVWDDGQVVTRNPNGPNP